MPFDALATLDRPKTLAETLEKHAVSPVGWQTLANHKRAQLEKFTPSFWHQHQAWLPVGLIGSVGCMAASGGLANGFMPASPLPSWLTLAWLAVIALLILFGVFRAHPGSHWEERWIPACALEGLGVPQPIASLARALQRDMPGSALILGELIQQQVVLDPYLLLEQDGERVCLGIWDGTRLIARARCRAQPLSAWTHRGGDFLA